MIYKSYLIEQNLESLTEKVVLFYGENFGLKHEFKKKIKNRSLENETFDFYQEEIIKDESFLIREIKNISLFQKKKIFFLENVNDKIFNILEQNIRHVGDNQIYLFADILDKKSKLRNLFEKQQNLACVPCYADNEISIKKIIQNKLKDFEGVSPYIINLICDNSNLDRTKLNNELEKIIICFENKKIIKEDLEALLDARTNDDFNLLKDEAIIGNRKKTNEYLSDTIIEPDKDIYYLSLINQRLTKLYQIKKQAESGGLEQAISNIKPPIFWKDKPIYLKQLEKWSLEKIRKVLNYTYEIEIQIKSNSLINKNLLLKKLLLDICSTANS